MRLHSLQVQRFGPFAERVTLDLDELTEQGLFLLHGPTGSGKTSLLDAVCFALYGSVPGARSKTERLTCDHGAAGDQPEVVCEFSASGRRFEVTRTPSWDRPKTRGSGTVRQQASVLVRELVAGRWVVRAERSDEAGLLLGDVLGMAKDQFTKVVLLPQGDFAAFLRANADERRVLLEKLFGTARFTDIENWLADQRNAVKVELTEKSTRRGDVLARADEHARVLADYDSAAITALAALPDDAADSASLELATAWRDAASLQRSTAGAAADKANQRLGACRVAAEQVGEKLRAAAVLESLLSRYCSLLSQQPALKQTRLRLDAAVRAEPLRGRLRSVETLTAAVASATRELEAAEAAASQIERLRPVPAAGVADRQDVAALDAAQLSFDIDAPDEGALFPELADFLPDSAPDSMARPAAGDLGAEIDLRRQLIGRLEAEASTEAELATAEASITSGSAQLVTLDAELNDVTEALTVLRSQSGERAATQAALEQLAATAPDRVRDHDTALACHRAAYLVAKLAPQLQHAISAHQAAADAALAKREQHLNLVDARLEGMAGELAAGLVDHQPCPVCGSGEHPEPAQSLVQVSNAEIMAAKQSADEARQLAEAAGAQREKLANQHTEALTVSGGLSVQAAHLALAEAKERKARAEQASADLTAYREESTALAAKLTELEAAVVSAGARRVELTTTLNQLRDEAASTAAKLVSVKAGFDTVQARLASVQAEVELLQSWSQARSALDAAVARREATVSDLEADCLAQGFPDRATALAALLEPTMRQQLAGDVTEADAAFAAVSERLVEEQVPLPETAAQAKTQRLAAAESRATLMGQSESAAAALVHADAQSHLAAARLAALATAEQALRALATGLRELVDATAPLRDVFERLNELANTTHGMSSSNTRRLRLSAFVLEARLEQVAAAASQRLQVMSDGRYTLLHSQSRGKGNGRSGLGLRVMDSWTSLERDTASLSGGESFLASLSLALGLADVVHAESGGLAIETLFIDEGFGTLDDDTLELVMEVLDSLREGGRAVGVVSHVAELRTRIPAQVQVVKGLHGSSVQQIDAVAS